jgi:hypothetical protein
LWWYKPFWKSHNGFWKWFLLGPTYHKKSPKRICKFNEALHIIGTMCVLKSWQNVNLGATSKENQIFVAWLLKVGNGIVFFLNWWFKISSKEYINTLDLKLLIFETIANIQNREVHNDTYFKD